jgi:uncharacterized membrane protein (UPF0182 family)
MELPEGFGDTEMIRELKQTVNELRALVSNIHAPISFNEQQLADYFGISKLSLERLRRSGKIGYKRVAGKIHYTRQHIEQFLNSK